jgi:hypothetical protein
MKKHILSLSLLLLALLALNSCKKDKDDNNSTPAETELRVLLQHQWDGLNFEYNQSYNLNGVELKFSEIRYYLSNFTAMDDGNNVNNFSPVLLIDAGVGGTEALGPISLNHLHMLSFNIGLDDATNHQDPTLATAPLNDPLMHWGWNPDQGYKFIKIQGEHNANGAFESFEIHVATDAMLRSTTEMIHSDVSGNDMLVYVNIPLEQWFANVDFSILTGTHGAGETATAVADAAQSSIAAGTESYAPFEISMMFHHKWGSEPFSYNQEYNVNGVPVIFQDVRYYLSNFVSMDMSMNATSLENVLLVDAGIMSTQTMGVLPRNSHIHMLNFILGLDATLNHQDPTIASAPLNDPLMHWGWNPDQGYKFIKIDGEFDADNDGIFEPFAIHVATDVMKRSITKNIHQDVSGDLTLHANLAMESWFAGLDFTNLVGVHGQGEATTLVVDAAAASITFE